MHGHFYKLKTTVVPAQAGTQALFNSSGLQNMDSRLRGNDGIYRSAHIQI